MMRGVAGVFLTLIDRIPELETTAYILILIISIKMALTLPLFNIHIESLHFFIILAVTFGATFIVHFMNKKKEASKENQS